MTHPHHATIDLCVAARVATNKLSGRYPRPKRAIYPVWGIEERSLCPQQFPMVGAFRKTILGFGLTLVLGVGASHAENLSISAIPALGIGKVVADSSVSRFHVDAATGAVTRVSGTAIRLTATDATVPTVTITCTQSSGNCKKTYTVTITNGTTTSGRSTTIPTFNVSSLSTQAGVTFSPAAPGPAAPLVFSIVSTNNSFTASFKLAFDATFNSSAVTGSTAWTYSVVVN